jgi:Phosphotransferase enzyme family
MSDPSTTDDPSPTANPSNTADPSTTDDSSTTDDPSTTANPSTTDDPSTTANPSATDDPPARYVSLMASLTRHSLVSLAIRVRREISKGSGLKDWVFGCDVLDFAQPKWGAYNLLYTLEFSDGIKWVLRIPSPGKDGRYTSSCSRLIRSDALTMSFIRQNTSIPIPEVFGFDETIQNEIDAPYILMQFVQGSRVWDVWFDVTGPTPLEERRLRILDTVAVAMFQLNKFRFNKIGSLQFDSDVSKPTGIGPCNVLDEQADLAAMRNELEPAITYLKIGPFNTSREYFKALFHMQEQATYTYAIGMDKLFDMMLDYIPRSVPTREAEIEPESFVLAHPDFDSQNILVSENGSLTALVDWDDIQTVPHCIGNTRYPGWITRDWDPLCYRYGLPSTQPENSPEELERYRSHYAAKMDTLVSETIDFTTKSHLYEALWIAASDQFAKVHIVDKIFTFLFPEELEETSIYLYETAVSLADNTLERDIELRIREALRDLLAYPQEC